MGTRWATFAIGLGLLLAPLVAGYGAPAAVLREIAAGTLVCVTALASLQWPRIGTVNLLAALWLVHSGRRAGDVRETSVEIAAAVLLLGAALLPRRRPGLPAPRRIGEARGT